MQHGHNIHDKAYGMAKAKMCAYPQSDHVLPQWKYVLQCFSKCPSINIPDQETGYQYPNTSPSIRFHVYHIIAHCTKHGRLPLTDQKSCRKCQQYSDSVQSTKMYTRREILMMEITISNFHTSFYIPEIWKLAFYITHVQILGTNSLTAICR